MHLNCAFARSAISGGSGAAPEVMVFSDDVSYYAAFGKFTIARMAGGAR